MARTRIREVPVLTSWAEVDRALRQYGKDTVLEVGANYKQTDVFWLEAAKDKLQALTGPEV